METETQFTGFDHFLAILLGTPLFEVTVALLVLLALVFLLFLITGSEISFFSITHSSLDVGGSGLKRKKLLLHLLDNPDRLKATLTIANIFLKMAMIGVFIINLHSVYLAGQISVWGIIISVFILSIALYLLGDVIPKIYAHSEPFRFSLWAVYPVFIFFLILSPISFIFMAMLKLFSMSHPSLNSQISADDLSDAIEYASSKLSDEEDLLKGIVKFGNIDVSEILKPRVDVVAIENKLLLSEVFSVVVESGYSRIPVYSGNFDDIRGILYVKDLLPYLNEKNTFLWQTLIRPPYFIPETKKVKELLTEFQTNKIHMAIIVDEYGGTLGIVTLEDILEEIVGEISDESDDDEKSYTKLNDTTYLFDGKTLLNDFHKILQTDNDIFDEVKGDADTLAGLILELKGAIPSKNEQIKYKQFTFRIEAVDTRRIKQIRVTIEAEDKN